MPMDWNKEPEPTDFTCAVCWKKFPLSMRQVHHVVQQAAGGTDKQTVDLCYTCHDTVHLIAKKLMKACNTDDINEIMDSVYDRDYRAKTRCMRIAEEAYKSMLLKSEGDPEYQPEFARLTVKVPADVKARLHMIAKESGQSIDSFLQNIIISIILNRRII